MAITKVLIADDELLIRHFLSETLRRKDIDVVVVENGKLALERIKKENFDLILTDMKMPYNDGIDVLKEAKKADPNNIVVIMTAFASVENAVEAMQLGAFSYLIKPFSPEALETILEKVQEHTNLINENSYLRQEISHSARLIKIIAQSSPIKHILKDLEKIAKSNASVFIFGESGTGKEVIAQTVHSVSQRANRPFIKVNCAAIAETLLESEFFGHEKGAFTGADRTTPGRFELANNGTLLLDEVTEIPLSLQPKLLRAIQEKEFERVGGTKSIKVDVRLISTSNRNMDKAIKDKVFREDLYYRLNVVPIYLPPLRDRREDIIPLANYFLELFCKENHKAPKTLTENATEKLLNYPWPGNVRELANIIERTVVMDFSKEIKEEHLYLQFHSPSEKENNFLPIGLSLKEIEKKMILGTLEKENYNKTKASKILKINVRTLRNKLKEYNMK